LTDDFNVPEQETLVNQQDKLQGNYLYSYNSIIHDISKIDVLRENTIYHRDRWIEIHEDQIYSVDLDKRISGGLFSTADFVRLFGKKARQIFQLLQKEGYVESSGGKIRIRSKFKIAQIDDFHLNAPPGWQEQIYKALKSLLVKRYPVSDETLENNETLTLLFSRKPIRVPAVRNSSKNYLFRMGNNLISIDFTQPPSPELLELVRLRLELVFEENMINFFQIASSFSADEAIWRQAANKSNVFIDVIVGLMGICWKMFDLEESYIRISGGTDLYQFSNVSLKYSINSDGESSFIRVNPKEFPDKIEDPHRDYMFKSMQLMMNRESFEPIVMDLYMRSRSLHNLSPKYNHLHHKFILMLIEKLAKTIEQVIPLLKAEEMEKHLKWKAFLDRARLRSMGWGEDLFRIMVDSVGILKTFLNIDDVVFYTNDQEFCKMLNIYESEYKNIYRNFRLITTFPSEEEIQKKHLIPIRLLEAINEELYLFITLPSDNPALSVRKNYLSGNVLVDHMLKVARGLGLSLSRDEIAPLMLSCLNSNPMLTMNKLIEKWPRSSESMEHSILNNRITQFASRFIEQLSLFFDVVQSLDNNIEAGITNMRGSRDRLTGLYNRQKFNQRLEQLQAHNQSLGLMFVDMDTFKIYNDAISHSFGDQLLIGLSERILQACRLFEKEALPARFGGDEFCFSLIDCSRNEFEQAAEQVFRTVTEEPEKVVLYFEERPRKKSWEVNGVSFFHRLLRPDVGGPRGAESEYIESKHSSPSRRLQDIYSYYIQDCPKGIPWYENQELNEDQKEQIIGCIASMILEKIERNKMFSNLDSFFSESIRVFIRGQMDDLSTQQIRNEFSDFLKDRQIILDMHYKISAGLAHNIEDRIRSISSLFKAADSRAYIAKHNGRNGLFGLDNQRLL